MKIAIYFFGISGVLLFVISVIGIMVGFPFNKLFLFLGSAFLFLVFLSLLIIERYQQNIKIKKILETHTKSAKKTIQTEEASKTKGWGINNSPFRVRRSGLTWGGGNIKGANATRGTRKNFLG